MDRMKDVMMGKTKSQRHDLFLDGREWEKCDPGNPCILYDSENKNSRLQQLSNPNFLGDADKWFIVIKQLRDIVFLKFLSQADPELKKVEDILGDMMFMMYSICVLFPETFTHFLEVFIFCILLSSVTK